MRAYSNFDVNRERAEASDEDWYFGGESQPGLANIPLVDRVKYLPKGEIQFGVDDYQDCSPRGLCNLFEAQFSYLYLNKYLPNEQLHFLKQYFNEKTQRIEFSNPFLAINSGTTRQGTSLKAPREAARKLGLIPKSMLNEVGLTFEEYHDPKRITKEMKDLGIEFTRRFVLAYEKVNRIHFSEALKDDFLNVAGHAWPAKINGVYPKNDGSLNHAFLLFNKPDFEAFDNYMEAPEDFTKTLAPDYFFYEEGYRDFILKQNGPHDRLINWQAGIDAIVAQLKLILVAIGLLQKQQTNSPEIPDTSPKPPANNLINTMCLAIQKHEGWYRGSRSQRNNNPGNLVYVGQPGATKESDGRFAVFATYEAGFEALKKMILNAATGKSKVYRPNMNLYEFFGVYAPAFENNDRHYAETVAKAMNVNPQTFLLSHLA